MKLHHSQADIYMKSCLHQTPFGKVARIPGASSGSSGGAGRGGGVGGRLGVGRLRIDSRFVLET